MIGEYDEFRVSRNLDLLVPNLAWSRHDLKKRLLKLTIVYFQLLVFLDNNKLACDFITTQFLVLKFFYSLMFVSLLK